MNDARVSKVLSRLERWLAKHRRRFLAGLAPGAAPAALDALQAQLGMPLPKALRTLLAWHNGQGEDLIGRFEEDWLLMSCDAIAAAKRDLDQNSSAAGWQKAWLPFLDNDAGDYLCLDTAAAAEPAVRAYWLGKASQIVASTLADWLEDFVGNVEKGKYVEERERGSFIRSVRKS
jgi:cell wall assembly regulator SMI1